MQNFQKNHRKNYLTQKYLPNPNPDYSGTPMEETKGESVTTGAVRRHISVRNIGK